MAGVRHLAERLGVTDRVALSDGFIPQAEVMSQVRSASVGVIPNLPTPLNRFALSTKLFEYISPRRPGGGS